MTTVITFLATAYTVKAVMAVQKKKCGRENGMNELISSPFFGVVLCIGTYAVGLWINRKNKITGRESAADRHCAGYCDIAYFSYPARGVQ